MGNSLLSLGAGSGGTTALPPQDPTCTLTASATSIASGASVVLTATAFVDQPIVKVVLFDNDASTGDVLFAPNSGSNYVFTKTPSIGSHEYFARAFDAFWYGNSNHIIVTVT